MPENCTSSTFGTIGTRIEPPAPPPATSKLWLGMLGPKKKWGSADWENHPVMKVAENAEAFHMDCAVSDGRVPGDLADDVRHLIEGYRVGVIEQRSANYAGLGEGGAGGADGADDGPAVDKRRGGAAESRLRIFGREGEHQGLIEVLGDPDLRLTCPGKARDILVVDDQRSVFRPRHDTHEIHGRQGPGLTGEEMGAKVVLVDGHVELPHAQIERIALVGIGCLRGAEEINLAPTG